MCICIHVHTHSLTHAHACTHMHTQEPLELPACRGRSGREEEEEEEANPHVGVLVPLARALMHKVLVPVLCRRRGGREGRRMEGWRREEVGGRERGRERGRA